VNNLFNRKFKYFCYSYVVTYIKQKQTFQDPRQCHCQLFELPTEIWEINDLDPWYSLCFFPLYLCVVSPCHWANNIATSTTQISFDYWVINNWVLLEPWLTQVEVPFVQCWFFDHILQSRKSVLDETVQVQQNQRYNSNSLLDSNRVLSLPLNVCRFLFLCHKFD
jgi:hypothetical protein